MIIQHPLAFRLLRPSGSGFAAGDLVLVLAVISLLAAVALPVISHSRSESRLAQCVENLKKINTALLAYADENDHRFPASKTIPAPGGWWSYKNELQGKLGIAGDAAVVSKVFSCPSDRGYSQPGEPIIPFCRSAKHHFTSYVFNGVTLPGIPNIAGREVASIKEPAKTLSIMEWSAHAPLSWHHSRTGNDNHPFYDGAESVVGFVDGHVALTPFYYDGMNAAYTRDPIPGYAYKFSAD